MFFYLKVNLNRDYAIRNIRYWVKTIEAIPDSQIFIVCDDDALKERISREVNSILAFTFIPSNRNDKTLRHIVENSCSKRWQNAGFAHLTTFNHALKEGENCFWNIDADDTRFCIDEHMLAAALHKVELKAKEKDMACISLDFYYSASMTSAWSFGITYVRDAYLCMDAAKQMIDSEKWTEYDTSSEMPTIDVYFRFLRNHLDWFNTGIFVIDDTIFIHYSDDMLFNPEVHGLYVYTDGLFLRPIFNLVMGERSGGLFFIPEDVEKIYINRTLKDAMKYLRQSTEYGIPEYKWNTIMTDFAGAEVLSIKRYLLGHDISEQSKVILYGVGKYLRAYWLAIRHLFRNIVAFCDCDSTKWNKRLIDNLPILSPSDIDSVESDMILVTISDENEARAIKENMTSISDKKIIWLGEMLENI